MPNPFYSANNTIPNSDYIKEIYNAMRQSNNPMQMFMRLAGNNPQMQPIINAMQRGINPQQIFNDICHQKGINPQQFLKSITG